jgi:hypothetical protein
MPSENHKLTNIIKGRSIISMSHENDVAEIHFHDGSMLKVKTSHKAAVPTINMPRTIVKARQHNTCLWFDTEDGESLQFTLQEETSSVMLRDKSGVLEYAD